MNKQYPMVKAVCVVCGAVFLARNSKAMFCSDLCRARGYTEMTKEERALRHEQGIRKLEEAKSKPASIETIASWQMEHRRLTGEWLGYTKAVEQMRKEGYIV